MNKEKMKMFNFVLNQETADILYSAQTRKQQEGTRISLGEMIRRAIKEVYGVSGE